VIKSTNATTPAPLIRPIQCRPVGGRARGVPLYLYPNDIFGVNEIIKKIICGKISFPCQIPDQNTLT